MISGCRWIAFLALVWCLHLVAASNTDHAYRIASLIDSAKHATLGERGANSRVQNAVYWLATARGAGRKARNGARPGP